MSLLFATSICPHAPCQPSSVSHKVSPLTNIEKLVADSVRYEHALEADSELDGRLPEGLSFMHHKV